MDKLDEIQLEIKSLHCSINEKLYFDQESGELILYKLCINWTKKAKKILSIDVE